MLLSPIEMLLPLVMLVLIFTPLIKVIKGKTSVRGAKVRLTTHICMFFGVCLGIVLFSAYKVHAATTGTDGMEGSIAQGLGFLAAALATGLSALGAGIAVAFAAPAAIGAFSENKENFGKAMIFVAMGEGVAIYGLLISIIMIFMKL